MSSYVDVYEVVVAEKSSGGKRTPLSAEDFRKQGQAEESWTRYARTWRRFFRWLVDNGHDDMVVDGVDVESNFDVFDAIKLPLSQVLFVNMFMK